MADIPDLDSFAEDILTGKCVKRVTVDGRTVEFASPLEKMRALKCLQEICDAELAKKRTCKPRFIGLNQARRISPCCKTNEFDQLFFRG